MQRFRAAGGDLLVGTDMQFGGIMYHHELRNLAALGLSPLDVIAQATGECAKALGLDGMLGTIKSGRLADLVVLNRSPLEDLSALRDIACVLKNGSIVWRNAREPIYEPQEPTVPA
jgi:imidazolonepropionase-like amidohydrolase